MTYGDVTVLMSPCEFSCFNIIVLISNKVNIDKHDPHKQKLFGILNFKEHKSPRPKSLKTTVTGQCVKPTL